MYSPVLLEKSYLNNFRMNNQLKNVKPEVPRDDPNQHQHIEMLETQLNAKILQMQDKYTMVSRLKLDR